MQRNKTIINEARETFFDTSSFPVSFLYTKKTKFKFKLLFKIREMIKDDFQNFVKKN